ncbi:Uncharacterised protein [Mycobacteroides abscessus]|nr:Uncharacterised protein [Mycobacteroides abscessus]CPU70636.1 Uncharacterised protein [Mycobacteroides abscessus]
MRTLVLFYAGRDLPRARLLFEAALDVESSEGRHLEHVLGRHPTGGTELELWPAAVRPVSRVQLELAVPGRRGRTAERGSPAA